MPSRQMLHETRIATHMRVRATRECTREKIKLKRIVDRCVEQREKDIHNFLDSQPIFIFLQFYRH